MFKKLNTTRLLIILAVLAGVVLFNKLYQSKKEESTFRSVFVSIDTSAVTSIFIYPQAEKGKEIKIIKNGSHWDLSNDKIKTIADSQAVRGLLIPFAEMTSLSLSGQDKSSWKDLQVDDSSGTRISFVTPEKRYDLIVGKFGYNQQTRSGTTNIRHADEEEVYTVEGFLSFSVNQPFNSWRNKTFIKGNKDNWTSLTFNYPGDSSFVLSKAGSTWTINGEPADSTKTAQYLNGLASLQATGFADGYTPSSTPMFTLSISSTTQVTPITVEAYPADSTQKFILHSSLNPEAYFSEPESHLMEKVFAGKSTF
jgi:hypothetical protein